MQAFPTFLGVPLFLQPCFLLIVCELRVFFRSLMQHCHEFSCSQMELISNVSLIWKLIFCLQKMPQNALFLVVPQTAVSLTALHLVTDFIRFTFCVTLRVLNTFVIAIKMIRINVNFELPKDFMCAKKQEDHFIMCSKER